MSHSSPRLPVTAACLAAPFLNAGRPAAARVSWAGAKAGAEEGDEAEEKIYALIEQETARAQTLKLPENRALFMTTAARRLAAARRGARCSRAEFRRPKLRPPQESYVGAVGRHRKAGGA